MLDQLRTLLVLLASVVAWAFGLATVWNKLVSKVNGLGGRVKRTEEFDAAHAARADEIRAHITATEAQLRSEIGALRERLNRSEIRSEGRMTRVETTLAIAANQSRDSGEGSR